MIINQPIDQILLLLILARSMRIVDAFLDDLILRIKYLVCNVGLSFFFGSALLPG